MSQPPAKPKGAMSVSDFANWASIGRTTAWKEIRDGHLRAVKVCAHTIIRFEDAEVWLATRSGWHTVGDFKTTLLTNCLLSPTRE